uniref:Pentacotripeptide-repeat region of PRORP domain-containing protein n=1 Tax=Oryza punctata TaxID=4537 RepID=A0A0E0LTR6_ORYPU
MAAPPLGLGTSGPLLLHRKDHHRCRSPTTPSPRPSSPGRAASFILSSPLCCHAYQPLHHIQPRLPQHPAFLLRGLVGIGDLDAALEVLDEMPGRGIAPDVVTYTMVLTAHCGKGGSPRPDATMHTLLIDSCCQCGMLQHAAGIMDASRMQPNEVTESAEARK